MIFTNNLLAAKLMPYPELTISIPAYNDSATLPVLIKEVQLVANELGVRYQILIIDDGSTDNTLAMAQELSAQAANITVISHTSNKGFGYTLKEIFTQPTTKWVLFLPGDNQFPASNLTYLWPLRNEYDFILGYRAKRYDSFQRKLNSWIYNQLLSLLLGTNVKDVNSIVFFRTSFIRHQPFFSSSAFIHAELFIKFLKANARITQVPVIHQPRTFGFGSGGNMRVILNTISDLFAYISGKIK
jgi:glycosyltransferase involved in cell wall biosynthesis